ncbi:MAG TPA: hypothetical protein VGF30_05240 [Bacteroidia bacterium]
MKGYKKILIQLFFVLFVTETFGIYKYIHFCGSEKTAESFFIEKNSCCCGDDVDENDDCCTDETAVIQLKEDVTSLPKTTQSPDDIPVHLFYENTFAGIDLLVSAKKNTSAIRESVLSDSHTPLIIKHRVLLI